MKLWGEYLIKLSLRATFIAALYLTGANFMQRNGNALLALGLLAMALVVMIGGMFGRAPSDSMHKGGASLANFAVSLIWKIPLWVFDIGYFARKAKARKKSAKHRE